MSNKITQRIAGYRVKPKEEEEPLHEDLPRPEVLTGASYKIKNPGSEHAIYVTINDIIVGGERRPYEIFINSKNMEHFQWVACITRLLSALFRKGGNYDFIIDEMKAVIDPKGGYFKQGTYIPSDIAAIGTILEQHLRPKS
jgi:ribonucleoside-diphosphate reductase alpha chain